MAQHPLADDRISKSKWNKNGAAHANRQRRSATTISTSTVIRKNSISVLRRLKAAKTLVKAIEDGKMSRIPADIVPVVLLYRHATELHLKVILLGYGANFLPVKPLPARIYGTHSLRKLAAQVCRILQAIGWYRGFK